MGIPLDRDIPIYIYRNISEVCVSVTAVQVYILTHLPMHPQHYYRTTYYKATPYRLTVLWG